MNRRGLFLVTFLLLSLVPVTANPKTVLKVDRVEYNEKNKLLSPAGATLIGAEWYSIQKLEDSTWTPLGSSYKDSVKLDKKITKDYTAYQVEYEATDHGTKSTVYFMAPEKATYRITWTLSGIDYTSYAEGFMGLNFTAPDHWVYVEWLDAVQAFGEIASYGIDGDTLTVTFDMGMLNKGESLTLDPVIFDSYTDHTLGVSLKDLHPSDSFDYSSLGQCFNATDNYYLVNAGFYMKKFGNPTGNGYARLYNLTGTYGEDGEPTGAALASSDAFNVATLGAATQLINFTFSTPYQLTANTQYCIAWENPAAGTIDNGNYIIVYRDNAAPLHSGNGFYYVNGAYVTFNATSTGFYVLGTLSLTDVVDVDNDDPFDRDEYGWVNATVYDFKGVADLNTVDLIVNTTGDTNNFTLRWTQATDTFSELSDPDSICTFDTVNSTRTNLNATHDLISYRFMFTGGQAGDCDIEIVVTSDTLANHSETYMSLFTFSFYNWVDEVYDFINSAFGQFGILDYMTQITAFINGLSVYFSDSLTHLLALVVQQFRVITNVYNFAVFWITELIGVALDFSVFYQSVVDGTSGWGTGIGDFWEIIEYDLWAPVVPLLLFIWWMESLAKRGAQTVGGELQVFINDMNTGISILSYFVSMFSLVANTIIDRVYGLFDAIV
jgi:hypothetical protein